jgi:predicted GH43/DUF377 family glycosyl hydrolase
MEPEPGNPDEAEGVLNPAAVRGHDGQLYLFPRLVSKGNYSRIGIARVQFNDDGDPAEVERLGIALEPEADYERRPGGGGCEDPRVTFVESIQRYLMTYTVLSTKGPRIALAQSQDLFHWRRLGLATFLPCRHLEFAGVDDKDASVFPIPIHDPAGEPAMALLHRPLFPGARPAKTRHEPSSRKVDLDRESIWLSYGSIGKDDEGHPHLLPFTLHHRLASPVAPWERLKIGGGTPPVLTRYGWLIVYHGVCEAPDSSADRHKLCYSAGVMVLADKNPRFINYRSPEPVLSPETPEERLGTVANVVFPTGIDRRDDLGQPDRFDVYYGMSDDRIGVARLDLPEHLPLGAPADHPEGQVSHSDTVSRSREVCRKHDALETAFSARTGRSLLRHADDQVLTELLSKLFGIRLPPGIQGNDRDRWDHRG